jgi:large subunit ribosomal protein L30
MLDGMLEEQPMGVPIQVKLVRSPIGRPEKHRRVLQGLGLSYVNKVVNLYSTPQILGAIRKVQHLLEVSEQQG